MSEIVVRGTSPKPAAITRRVNSVPLAIKNLRWLSAETDSTASNNDGKVIRGTALSYFLLRVNTRLASDRSCPLGIGFLYIPFRVFAEVVPLDQYAVAILLRMRTLSVGNIIVVAKLLDSCRVVDRNAVVRPPASTASETPSVYVADSCGKHDP
jgi:hypothetical protein